MRMIDADALDKRIYNDVPISTFGSIRRMAAVRELPNWCGNCGADMRKMEVQG